MGAQAAGRIHPLKVCVTAAADVNPGCTLTDFNAEEAAGSPLSAAGQRQTFMFYAICVSKKKSVSGLTSEFIATCSECTCSLRCLTYSYAACSRSKSG